MFAKQSPSGLLREAMPRNDIENMYRSILLSALVYGLLLAGLITLRGELIALAIPFMLYLLYGFWNAPEALDLSHRAQTFP